MNTAKIFPNGASQAVRLPKEFQFSGNEVCVNKVGDVVLLFPREKGWDILSESLKYFSEDYMLDRNQAEVAESRSTL